METQDMSRSATPDSGYLVCPGRLVVRRHIACLIAGAPDPDGQERLALEDREAIRIGGTLYVFGYFRELRA